jgi:hypothetical protein
VLPPAKTRTSQGPSSIGPPAGTAVAAGTSCSAGAGTRTGSQLQLWITWTRRVAAASSGRLSGLPGAGWTARWFDADIESELALAEDFRTFIEGLARNTSDVD